MSGVGSSISNLCSNKEICDLAEGIRNSRARMICFHYLFQRDLPPKLGKAFNGFLMLGSNDLAADLIGCDEYSMRSKSNGLKLFIFATLYR